jgi:hypothetical protein
MSANMVTPNTATLTRWQRFIDWLAGGPPDPEKIAEAQLKPWYKRYLGSVVIWLGGWLIFFPYPIAVDLLNLQPDARLTKTVQAKVLQTREKDPHLLLELPNGERVSAYWPKSVHLLGSLRFHGWTREERLALVGCEATVVLSPIKYWVWFQQQRVWALHCPDTGFEATQEQTQAELTKSVFDTGSWLFQIFLTLFVLAPLGFVFFLRERRGVL